MKRVLRFLNATKYLKLRLEANVCDVIAYSDADWAGGADRVSTSGHVIFFGDAVTTWKSTKQKCIALSSTEAEYVSLSECSREITWIRNLCSELGHSQENATKIFDDNTGAITWAMDISNFKRNKHIDLRLHHMRDLVEKNILNIQPIETNLKVADGFTKRLYGPKFKNSSIRLQLSDFEPSGRKIKALITISNKKRNDLPQIPAVNMDVSTRTWFLDSSTNNHYATQRSAFEDYVTLQKPQTIGPFLCIGRGAIEIVTDEGCLLHIHEVYHSPRFLATKIVPEYNIPSIHNLIQSKCILFFAEDFCEIHAISLPGNQMVIGNAKYVEDQYILIDKAFTEEYDTRVSIGEYESQKGIFKTHFLEDWETFNPTVPVEGK